MNGRIRRVFWIVLDSFGVGELPDAARYGDEGSNTLKTVTARPELQIPNLTRLGLYRIPGTSCEKAGEACGVYGKMAEASAGKDTTTGHWEMAGLISEQPMPTFPEGFPPEIIEEFARRTGRGVLCNRPYSGTQVIRDYGLRQKETGDWIVYTSADSVFQVAAHEQMIPVEELYAACREARQILTGPYGVGRVIARPYAGEYPDYYRTSRRHDFSRKPFGPVLPQLLQRNGFSAIAVGKIYDIFAGEGFESPCYTASNAEGMQKTEFFSKQDFHGLCFSNLVDFDMLYGHRNDAAGYAAALTEFDRWLGSFMQGLGKEDLLIITADHGCDPGTPSTDHSREYVPVLLWNPDLLPMCLGVRESFSDLGSTVAEIFGLEGLSGKSFWKELRWRDDEDL